MALQEKLADIRADADIGLSRLKSDEQGPTELGSDYSFDVKLTIVHGTCRMHYEAKQELSRAGFGKRGFSSKNWGRKSSSEYIDAISRQSSASRASSANRTEVDELVEILPIPKLTVKYAIEPPDPSTTKRNRSRIYLGRKMPRSCRREYGNVTIFLRQLELSPAVLQFIGEAANSYTVTTAAYNEHNKFDFTDSTESKGAAAATEPVCRVLSIQVSPCKFRLNCVPDSLVTCTIKVPEVHLLSSVYPLTDKLGAAGICQTITGTAKYLNLTLEHPQSQNDPDAIPAAIQIGLRGISFQSANTVPSERRSQQGSTKMMSFILDVDYSSVYYDTTQAELIQIMKENWYDKQRLLQNLFQEGAESSKCP